MFCVGGIIMNKYVAFLPEDDKDYISVYWGYYHYLEEEFLSVFSSNPIDKYRAASLYLSIGSEIDVMFKVLILIMNKDYAGDDINKHKEAYQELVSDGNMDPYDIQVTTLKGNAFRPWSNTGWWKLYNKVKHQRVLKDANGDLFFFQATQANVEQAL